LENFFRLLKPFLLQVCGYVSENFVFVHCSISSSKIKISFASLQDSQRSTSSRNWFWFR
jgi:hypothetical protein